MDRGVHGSRGSWTGRGASRPNHPVSTSPPTCLCPSQFGLATLLLTLLMPLGGLISFRRMGIIQRFPEVWQPRIKFAHKKVSRVQDILNPGSHPETICHVSHLYHSSMLARSDGNA